MLGLRAIELERARDEDGAPPEREQRGMLADDGQNLLPENSLRIGLSSLAHPGTPSPRVRR